jgi:hypothetical protein
MTLTGRRPAEIFFSASFSLHREKLPYPALLFDGQLEKTRQAPGTSSLALHHPRSDRPQETCPSPQHSPRSQELPFPRSREHHHRPTTPQVRFRRLRLPGTTLVETRPLAQRLRRPLLPQVQTQNQTDDIFLAQILGHKLLGPNASLSVGQSYKDFYIRKP